MGMNQKAWKDATEPEIFLEYVQSQCDEAFLPKVRVTQIPLLRYTGSITFGYFVFVVCLDCGFGFFQLSALSRQVHHVKSSSSLSIVWSIVL